MKSVRCFIVACFLLVAPPANAFFTQAEIDSVQNDPAAIVSLYNNRIASLQSMMGAPFAPINQDGWKTIFSALVAYEMKPYGPSTVFTLNELLAEQVLDCDNYLALTYHFLDFLQPSPAFSMAMVGWDNGWVGNHAQGITAATGLPLIIDPTVAVFAIAGFNQIMRGSPVNALYSFHVNRSAVDWLHDKVTTGLQQGKYNPVDLLYYFNDLNEYVLNRNNQTGWATPQAPNGSGMTRLQAIETLLIQKNILTLAEIDALVGP